MKNQNFDYQYERCMVLSISELAKKKGLDTCRNGTAGMAGSRESGREMAGDQKNSQDKTGGITNNGRGSPG